MPYKWTGNQNISASPYTHFQGAWGDFVTIKTDLTGAVSTSQPATTELVFEVSPFPYCWIYDIVVMVTGTGNPASGNTPQVDVYNTNAAGTSANSYLSSPIVIAKNLSATTLYSARFQSSPVYQTKYDPTSWSQLSTWYGSYVFARGQIFSVRAITTSTSGCTITNMRVYIILAPSDGATFDPV